MTVDHPTQHWLPRALASLRRDETLLTALVIGPDEHPRLGERLIVEVCPSRIPYGPLSDAAAALDDSFDRVIGEVSAMIVEARLPGDHAHAARLLVSRIGPHDTAWIFGAGHIAQALAPLLTGLGFRIHVCDDRAEFATAERFPDASQRLVDSFPRMARACASSQRPWVVLVTRGHLHDEQILRALRHSDCAYLGMIGSKRRVRSVMDRLKGEGAAAEFINRIHAPIGVPIGADSPQEIAVSIAAEMIAVRRGVDAGQRLSPGATADTSGISELWSRVAEVITTGRPAVLATIVERKGSTPRGLGAQMAVFADGAIAGTIGGGCGEEEVRTAARRLLVADQPASLLTIDLTGDPRAESADICGGRYAVVLERLP